MEINIQATPGVCTQFMDGKGKLGEVSTFIAPLKVETNDEGGKLRITYGCNLWKSCKNEGCYYSMAARIRSKQ